MDYREELLRTPQILERVMEEKQEAALTRAPLLVFCGCGTSFYLCSQMAGLCGVQGRRALAVEAAELLEDGIRIREQGAFFLFLSRSGASRETVLAQRAAQEAGFSTFYLGCTAGSPLDLACGGSRVIPFAREALVLESYSSTAQLLCLALCCGLKVSPRTPDLARAALEQAEAIYRSALTGMEIRRMICLGAPFYLPLVKDLLLKNGEITQKFSEVWGLLEFRHGPRSWADRDCLVTAVPGVRTLAYDRRVGEELVSYGCRVLWCGPEPPAGTLAVKLEAAVRSVEECLALLTFQTGLAAEIGRACGVDAGHLRHVVDSVGEL